MNASAPSERSVRAVWRTGWLVDIACGDFALTADEYGGAHATADERARHVAHVNGRAAYSISSRDDKCDVHGANL